MKDLSFELKYGALINDTKETRVELLRTNGVAEKVFVDKFPEKPYSWMGTVCAIACKSIGSEQIGASARKEFLETGNVTIPQAIQKLPLGELNSVIIEIHRRVWKSTLPEQEVVCKYCGSKSIMQIDLDKISYDEKDIEKFASLEENKEGVISVNLPEGFVFNSPKKYGTSELAYPEYDGLTFNRFKFRVPLLQDAIRNEKYNKESIVFWRRLAFDCIVSAECVIDDVVTAELNSSVLTSFGLTLYNEMLYNKDLAAIREGLRECVPTLPFYYEDTCTNCKRETPVTMEPSNFFSE